MVEQIIKSLAQDKKVGPIKENILVIQKDLAERRVMQLVFSQKYTLYFARDIETAIPIGRNFSCKVVIFDASSASSNVISELIRFKAGISMESPIILLASKNTFEIEKKVAAIGVFYHLIRPYSVKDLEELIEAALRYWQRTFGWTRAVEKT